MYIGEEIWLLKINKLLYASTKFWHVYVLAVVKILVTSPLTLCAITMTPFLLDTFILSLWSWFYTGQESGPDTIAISQSFADTSLIAIDLALNAEQSQGQASLKSSYRAIALPGGRSVP